MNENRFTGSDVAVLHISNDVLLGQACAENLQKLSKAIGSKGRYIGEIRTVQNIPSIITKHVKELANAFQLLIVVGGIGVMHDCHATVSIANATLLTLEENSSAKQALLNALKRGGIQYCSSYKKIFELPYGSLAMPNEMTGISGFRVQNIIAMPNDESFDVMCDILATDLCSWYKSYMCRIPIGGSIFKVAEIVESFAKNQLEVQVGVSYLPRQEIVITATDFEILHKKVDILKEKLLLEKLDFSAK